MPIRRLPERVTAESAKIGLAEGHAMDIACTIAVLILLAIFAHAMLF